MSAPVLTDEIGQPPLPRRHAPRIQASQNRRRFFEARLPPDPEQDAQIRTLLQETRRYSLQQAREAAARRPRRLLAILLAVGTFAVYEGLLLLG
jgi:hypothetical protein